MTDFEVVDCQVHVWDSDTRELPWYPIDHSPFDREVREHFAESIMSVDKVIAAMDEARVDAAIVVTPGIYGFDNTCSFAAASRYPDRLAVVGPLDPQLPDIAERVERWSQIPAALGLRPAFPGGDLPAGLLDGHFDPMLRAAELYDVPVCLRLPGFPVVEALARRFPSLQLLVDHLGLRQPPLRPASPEPFEQLAELLQLAQYDNVALKVSGVPTLSREPYPFHDVWPALHAIFRAFGLDRTMWGSDFTRTASLHSYAEATNYLRDSAELSEVEKKTIMGTTVRRIFHWPRPSVLPA